VFTIWQSCGRRPIVSLEQRGSHISAGYRVRPMLTGADLLQKVAGHGAAGGNPSNRDAFDRPETSASVSTRVYTKLIPGGAPPELARLSVARTQWRRVSMNLAIVSRHRPRRRAPLIDRLSWLGYQVPSEFAGGFADKRLCPHSPSFPSALSKRVRNSSIVPEPGSS
jgi:hypothetical protein